MESKKDQRVCRFFTLGNCKYGEDCKFMHAHKPQANHKAQSTSTKKPPPEEMKLTSYKEDLMIIAHSQKITTPIHFQEFSKSKEGKDNYERNNTLWGEKGFLALIREVSKNSTAQDLCQVIRRFQHEIFFGKLDSEEFSETSSIYIRFSPSCKYEIIDELHVKEGQFIVNVEIGKEIDFKNFEKEVIEYNSNKRKVKIINESLDKEYKDKLNKAINYKLKEFSGKLFLLFKFIDSYFNELFDISKNIEILEAEKLKKDDEDHNSNDENLNDNEDKFYVDSSNSSDNEEKKKNSDLIDPKLYSLHHFQTHFTYNVLVNELVHSNVGVITLHETTMNLSCKNCRKESSITVFPNVKHQNYLINVLPCLHCNTSSRSVIHTEPAHMGKEKIGFLGIANWNFNDFLFVSFVLSCEECGNDMILKDASRGKNNYVKCFTCFKEMTLSFQGLSLEEFHNEAIEEINTKQANKPQANFQYKPKRQVGMFKPGQPLVRKGACKHYKFSYRWFRFPCCEKVYPCDNCHFETEKHIYEKAESMVCGFCSTEQKVHSVCTKCGEALTKEGPKSGHWEGGKGCRNTKAMSKNDPKKFKGVGKTQSKKK